MGKGDAMLREPKHPLHHLGLEQKIGQLVNTPLLCCETRNIAPFTDVAARENENASAPRRMLRTQA
ncbi:MAG: hypothetical protein KatS3mg073_0541 [Meiothermus sp.]|nr:MAG: hypothetical protein KatS3mg073_0541 [Meiothermus sp.]